MIRGSNIGVRRLRLSHLLANVEAMQANASTALIPAGEFLPRYGATQAGLGLPAKIGIAATLIAVVAGTTAAAALLLWLASVLLPIAALAGLVAYAAFRIQFPRPSRR